MSDAREEQIEALDPACTAELKRYLIANSIDKPSAETVRAFAAGYSKRTPGGEAGLRHRLVLAFIRAKAEGYTDDEAADLLTGAALSTRPAGESAGVAAALEGLTDFVEGLGETTNDAYEAARKALAALASQPSAGEES